MQIVIGDNDAKIEYYKKKGVDVRSQAEVLEEKTDDAASKKITVDAESTEPLTDEELRLLTRTRNRHNPHEVYMQSDISFYDQFYTEADDAGIDPDLSAAAHQIRRVYKNYREYLEAMNIRDAYIEAIFTEKYGGNMDMFRLEMQSGESPYWIPPIPICTRSARKKAVSGNKFDPLGIMKPQNFEADPENRKKALEVLTQDRINTIGECDADKEGDGEVSIYSDVCTDYRIIQDVNEGFGVNLRDDSSGTTMYRDNLQSQFDDIIKGWYQDEKNSSEMNKLENKAFRYSEEKIRERFMQDDYVPDPKDFECLLDPDYDPDEDKTDWNETVYDPATGRAMSRSESYRRKLVRDLSKFGYNELHLMDIMKVGTRIERAKKVRAKIQTARSKYKCKPETIALREEKMSGDYYGEYGGYGDYQEADDYNFFDNLDSVLKGGSSWN